MKKGDNKLEITVDEYIAAQPETHRKGLETLRTIIKKAAPDATEKVSYGVPCFSYLYMLVAFGTTKKHCSLYGMSTAIMKDMKEEFGDLEFKGSTLYFPPEGPFPEELISKIVMTRVKENELRALAKKK